MKKVISLSLLSISLVACANNPFRSYNKESTNAIKSLNQGKTSVVLEQCESSSDVVLQMECGSVQRFDSSYSKSNVNFSNANLYVDAWAASFHNKTGGAVLDATQAGLLNDSAIDYQVKDYEKVMLSTYKSMNLISLGQYDDARIEMQRMYQLEQVIKNYREQLYAQTQANTQKEQQYSSAPSLDKFEAANRSKYDFTSLDDPTVLALKNGYQSAFSHYLAGYLFEALGEPDLARPGYLNSYKINPTTLSGDAVKNLDNNNLVQNGYTDLLIIEEVGHAPQLKSVNLNVPYNFGSNNCVGAVSIAFPELTVDKTDYPASNISVNGKAMSPIMLTDIDLMAKRSLKDNIPNLFINNMIRVTRDVVAQQLACKSGNAFVSLGTTLSTAFLSSQADERSWVFLPSKFYVTRVRVPYGQVKLDMNTQSGSRSYNLNVSQPYQVVDFRIMGSTVYFNKSANM